MKFLQIFQMYTQINKVCYVCMENLFALTFRGLFTFIFF